MSKTKMAKAAVSTYHFTTTFFKDPNDTTLPWIPHDGQIKLYDIMDYGYDVRTKVIRPPEDIELVLMSWPRQKGKTEGVASNCAALLIRFPGAQIGVMSNSHDNAKKLITRIYRFLEHGGFKTFISSRTVESITLTNGSRIDSFGQTSNIRGNSYWWLIIDEAAMFKTSMIEGDAIPTTRTAGAFKKFGTPSVILLSTPKGTTGRFAELYMKGVRERWIGCRKCGTLYTKDDFKGHGINWFSLDNLLGTPDSLECENCGHKKFEYVNRYYTVVSISPYQGTTKKALDKELALRGNTPIARQELLGEFIGGGANVYRREWLEACVNTRLTNAYKRKHGIKYYMGIDFGKAHDATCFVVCHKGKDGVVFDWIDIMPGRGQEYADIRVKMIEHIIKWNPVWILPDTTGMGNAVCEQLNRDIIALKKFGLRVEYGRPPQIKVREFPAYPKLKSKIYSNKKGHYGFMFDMNSKPEIIDHLATLFMHGGIQIPPEPVYKVQQMWDEIVNFGYEFTDSGRIKYGIQSVHDDTVIALALACWGINQKPFIMGKPMVGTKDMYSYERGVVESNRESDYSIGF